VIKKKRAFPAARIGAYALVSLYLLVTAGFLFVDYVAALYLGLMAMVLALIGVLSPYLRSFPVRWRRWRHDERTRRSLPRVLMLPGAVLTIVFCIILLILFVGGSPRGLCTYEILLEPTDSSLKSFRLEEGLRIEGTSPQSWQFPERQVIGTNRGVLLKEVKIEPSQDVLEACPTCRSGCSKAEIELVDFPSGSLYQIKGEEDRMTYPYLDTETITCSVHNPRQGVAFAYLPPPYYQLGPILEPLVAMSSSQLGVLSIGSLGLVVLAFAARVAFPKLPALPVVRDVRRAGAQRHRIALKKRLADLVADYEAANRQLGATLSEVDRVRLKRQIEAIEDEISEVQGRLAGLQE
jgi:hypothetical protein